MKGSKTRLLAVLIVLAALGVSAALYMAKPKAVRKRPARPTPIVNTLAVKYSSHTVSIEAFGEVVPSERVELLPRVSGVVQWVSPALQPGSIVQKGELLVRLDREDYDLEVKKALSDVKNAQYELELEKGRAEASRREWRRMAETGRYDPDEAPSELVLRKPHLEKAEAEVEAAQSKLEEARLKVKRTEIKAPFRALVLDESAAAGKLLSTSTVVAVLADTRAYRVSVSVPVKMAHRVVTKADGGRQGARAYITPAEGQEGFLSSLEPIEARVFALKGELEPESKMARLLLEIKDPLGLDSVNNPAPLLLGSFVRAEIEAGVIDNAIEIPSGALRDDRTIWLMSPESRLEVLKAEVLWTEASKVLIRPGSELKEGYKLITSRLRNPLEGMQVSEAQADKGEISGLGGNGK